MSVPQHTGLCEFAIDGDTKLLKLCPSDIDEINEWIQNNNQNEEHALRRECACIEPSEDNIHEILNERGLQAFSSGNDIGITAAPLK